MKNLLAVDGNSLLNRAFYGIRPLTAPDGSPTAAVYGMANMLLARLDEVMPDYAAVAFDLRAPTFRHKLYDGYKATRHGMPDELAAQLATAKEFCAALGFTVLEKEGYEADDILGTLAKLAEESPDTEAFIMTGDRDSLQLISDRVRVLLAGNGGAVLTDRAAFREKYGAEPPVLVDIKALMGDSSDNIPGVAGVGEKTALRLIASCGSLDGVYAALDAARSPDGSLPAKIAALPAGPAIIRALDEKRQDAYLSRTLATIERDVPLGITAENIAYHGFDRAALAALCRRLGFTGFIKRLSLDTDTGKADAPRASVSVSSSAARELPPPELAELPAGRRWAVTLTEEESGLMSGYLLAASDGEDNIVSRADSLFAFADFLSDRANRPLTVCDLKTLCTDARRAGFTLSGDVFDLSLAGYVLDSTANDYSVPHLAAAYLGQEGEGTAVMAALTPALCAELERTRQTAVFRDIELPTARLLADMEENGFRIDREGLHSFGDKITQEENQLLESICADAGVNFNLNSPRQLGEVLFERLGLPHAKKTKTKTGYSTSADILEQLRPYHPIIDKILRYRQLEKLRGTYVTGLLAAADGEGRVHTAFQQTVTATGRLSSTEPNLQNIPIRTPLGRELRRYFIPAEGCVLVDADYSQIELRLLAYMSGDETMLAAFRDGVDIHALTASQVFGVPLGEVTPEQRKAAKAVNFGIVYGIGEFSLGADLGISRAEAGEYIKGYFTTYPQVESYMSEVTAQAKTDGFVTTLAGRRRYIPELKAGKAPLRAFGERVARNSPIQGTAADIMKTAMLRADRAIRESGIDARIILQVHDELVLEAAASDAAKAAELLRGAMEGAAPPMVLPVEVTTGGNWYE